MYISNGADIIETATYQFSKRGVSEQEPGKEITDEFCYELIAKAIALVHEAILLHPEKQGIKVALSFGSYGAVLCDRSEYTGSFVIEFEDLVQFHRWRLASLKYINHNYQKCRTKVDYIAIETIPSLFELEAVCEAVKNSNLQEDIKVWVSMTLQTGHKTASGDLISECVDIVNNYASYISGFGFNCSDLDLTIQSTSHLKNLDPRIKLVLYPNAKLNGRIVSSSEFMGYFAEFMINHDKNKFMALGGCCGTNEEYISKLRTLFRNK